jgi:transketolase
LVFYKGGKFLYNKLIEKCKQIRIDILREIGTFGMGHIGGSLSIVEVLVVLYNVHLKIEPKNPKLAGRDRFVLSKGHGGPALYAVLGDCGYFNTELLKTLNGPGTSLPSHPDMHKIPGVDMTTGSLGQGFSCAAGMAAASKLCGDNATIYVIIGDGETQEGQIWESAMFAAHNKLNNLIAFVDNNKLQLDGYTENICNVEPLDKKFEAFGWNVINVADGNDCKEIDEAILAAKTLQKTSKKPNMIILNTIKGYGISFVQNAGILNHSMVIDKSMLTEGLNELGGEI